MLSISLKSRRTSCGGLTDDRSRGCGLLCDGSLDYCSGGGTASKYRNPQDGEVRTVYDQPLKKALLGEVAVLSWNVAGVNNNPFEYWVTAEEDLPAYTAMMRGVEVILQNPKAVGDQKKDMDIPVRRVFTEEMWLRLKDHMNKLDWPDLDMVENVWINDFSERCIITEFLLDKELGKKRFVSMPDRFTNTIRIVRRKYTPAAPQLEPVYRPSVINNYGGDLSSVEAWWEDWQQFMFERRLVISTPLGPGAKRPCEMLETIRRSKYPAVTKDEERLSIPLQVLSMAIFDAILVHIMNSIFSDGHWMAVKTVLVDLLYRRKHSRTLDILSKYQHVEVLCLQETTATFGDHLQMSGFKDSHKLMAPSKFDGKRDQNSIILLDKRMFINPIEVTDQVMKHFPRPNRGCIADGDLIVVSARHSFSGKMFAIVCFHADTDGLLTIPILEACHGAKVNPDSGMSDHHFLLALDANAHEKPKEDQQGFDDLLSWLLSCGFTTMWGDEPEKKFYRTTCHSRTVLQPQFQKGISYVNRVEKSDRNPKDLILFYKDQLLPSQPPLKDNTGEGVFLESTLLPTLTFPSDHALVATVLALKK